MHSHRDRALSPEHVKEPEVPASPEILIDPRSRFLVVTAAMLALFLGALDALVMGSAMPTIVGDLGGLHLYSWVFSAYMLTRSVSLPLFGKLADLFDSKKLYIIAIGIFLLSSLLAGAAQSMTQLILSRAIQGIGAGGNFALAYIVVSDVSPPEKRGKMMAFISFVWGVSSVLGPTLGGFIVNYFSWRWIFYINLPLGGIALVCIVLYLKETRQKKKGASVDYLGALTLSVTILALLMAFLFGGRSYDWLSPEIMGLFALTLGAGVGFYYAEKRAKEPILPLSFFRIRGFSLANSTAFFSSFAIFSLSAFSPLFIQGALDKTPAQLGIAMVPLSLGWSVGALICGQLVNRLREKPFSLLGSLLLVVGSALTLTFSTSTSLAFCSTVLALSGMGMGFVSIGTLLMVQNSLSASSLGVATSSHQFARTLGGTVGVGISGSLVTVHLTRTMEQLVNSDFHHEIPSSLLAQLHQGVENLFRPEIQSLLSVGLKQSLHEAVGQGVMMVFWATLIASSVSLLFSYLLPEAKNPPSDQ